MHLFLKNQRKRIVFAIFIVTTTTKQQAGYQQHCQGKQTHQLLHGCKGNEALYGL